MALFTAAPIVPVVVVSLIFDLQSKLWGKDRSHHPLQFWAWQLGVTAALLFIFSSNTSSFSLLPLLLWPLLTNLLTEWPRLFPNAPVAVKQGGPFGRSCFKIVQVMVGSALLLLQHRQRQQHDDSSSSSSSSSNQKQTIHFQVGQLPSLSAVCLVLIFSLLVNGVLMLWSKLLKTRGNHTGVFAMVDRQEHDSHHHDNDPTQQESSRNNSKTKRVIIKQHTVLVLLAVANAICEEGTYRGIWRSHYTNALLLSSSSSSSSSNVMTTKTMLWITLPAVHWCSNLIQAAVFGIGHYNGIPSGMTGVVLTFVYGGLLGLMADVTGGLVLPILTHSIADYFIFAVIARQKELTPQQHHHHQGLEKQKKKKA